MHLTQDQIKQRLGARAAEYVEDGMLVGLGTGSTATCLIDALIMRCQQGLRITAVSSSLRSQEQAKKGGIPLVDFQKVEKVDLTIDGADEIDPYFRLIKGGGGAHLREKILATASKQLLIIADETKWVERLGTRSALPLEIVPFGITSTIAQIHALGYQGKLRMSAQETAYLTDNKNYIYDITMKGGFLDPELTERELLKIPAIIESGFFFNLASEILIGYQDGHIEKKIRKSSS